MLFIKKLMIFDKYCTVKNILQHKKQCIILVKSHEKSLR